MGRFAFVFGLIAVLALTGCSRLGGSGVETRSLVGSTGPGQAVGASALPPQQATRQNESLTDLQAFLGVEAVAKMSDKDRSEATSAQYYALQFGRPGAPRSWQGDSGAGGSVSVGPYVRVNSLDCREFSHSANVGGTSYKNSGTACREADGSWDVVGG